MKTMTIPTVYIDPVENISSQIAIGERVFVRSRYAGEPVATRVTRVYVNGFYAETQEGEYWCGSTWEYAIHRVDHDGDPTLHVGENTTSRFISKTIEQIRNKSKPLI